MRTGLFHRTHEQNTLSAGRTTNTAQAGEEPFAHQNGQLIADQLPVGALKFVDKQPFVVTASLDQQESFWVSLLAGSLALCRPKVHRSFD
ncbi:hypothetical protein [Spirosoma jeollabukense]